MHVPPVPDLDGSWVVAICIIIGCEFSDTIVPLEGIPFMEEGGMTGTGVDLLVVSSR